MKTAEKNLPFGDIIKTFGANGELLVKLSNKTQAVNLKEPIFITIDGLPVPFFFKSFVERGNDRAIIVFDDMETEHTASTLVGKRMWTPNKKQFGNKNFDLNDLVGFTANDLQLGELGKISEFLNFANNPCFQIICKGKEIIIPINESLISEIDTKSKNIYFNLPSGLVDLYMQ